MRENVVRRNVKMQIEGAFHGFSPLLNCHLINYRPFILRLTCWASLSTSVFSCSLVSHFSASHCLFISSPPSPPLRLSVTLMTLFSGHTVGFCLCQLNGTEECLSHFTQLTAICQYADTMESRKINFYSSQRLRPEDRKEQRNFMYSRNSRKTGTLCKT